MEFAPSFPEAMTMSPKMALSSTAFWLLEVTASMSDAGDALAQFCPRARPLRRGLRDTRLQVLELRGIECLTYSSSPPMQSTISA